MTRRWIIAIVWLAAFGVALAVDAPVAYAVRGSGLAWRVRGSGWAEAIKFFGTFQYPLVAAVLLLQFRRSQWKPSLLVIAAAAISGLNVIPKWVVGQLRPFKPDGVTVPRPFHLQPFWQGLPGLLGEHDLAFPSGHACLSAAVAAALWSVRPGLGLAAAVIAVIVGVERVIENAHYVDDVVAGFFFGITSAAIASRLAGAKNGMKGLTWSAR
jgi:membrane-associated phospholipid phosphatase